MKTIQIIALLQSTDEYDVDAPYVYLEIDFFLLQRLEKASKLYGELKADSELGLIKLTIHGPSMVTLNQLPNLTKAQRKKLDEDDSLLLNSPIPESDLETLGRSTRLCGEAIDILGSRWLYAVANNKYTREIYEANISSALNQFLDFPAYAGKENLPDADD